MRLVLILSVSGILGILALSGCNSAEQQAKTQSPVATSSPAATAPADNVRRITVPEAKDLLEKNEAFVLDVRNQASYNAGHIRGAKLIPVGEVPTRLGEVPKGKLIITYCS